ncbi:unnamed protein product, partial [Ectocarpus sp. 12 AP-2014]
RCKHTGPLTRQMFPLSCHDSIDNTRVLPCALVVSGVSSRTGSPSLWYIFPRYHRKCRLQHITQMGSTRPRLFGSSLLPRRNRHFDLVVAPHLFTTAVATGTPPPRCLPCSRSKRGC